MSERMQNDLLSLTLWIKSLKWSIDLVRKKHSFKGFIAFFPIWHKFCPLYRFIIIYNNTTIKKYFLQYAIWYIKLTNLAVFAIPAFKALTLNTFIFFVCSAVTIVITRVGWESARCKFCKQNNNNSNVRFSLVWKVIRICFTLPPTVRRTRWTWIKHVLRMDNNSLPRFVLTPLTWALEGKHSKECLKFSMVFHCLCYFSTSV